MFEMKQTHIAMLAFAVALYCVPAFAQHGHAGGNMGGGMDSGVEHSNAASSHGLNDSSTGSGHRMTVDQQLSKNTKLADKIQTLTGMDAQKACDGFKNLGQCVAAAHVSKNLKISFACLKSDMTGTAPVAGSTCPAGTGSKSLGLGKSIQTLSPHADSKSEEKKGTHEANEDLKETHS